MVLQRLEDTFLYCLFTSLIQMCDSSFAEFFVIGCNCMLDHDDPFPVFSIVVFGDDIRTPIGRSFIYTSKT